MRAIALLYSATFILLAFVLVLAGHCQTAILLPPPKIQFFDVNGNPLAGGFVFTYQAGTAIAQTTYADSGATIVNSDPIVLDAGGFPSSPLGPGQQAGIYFINGASYKICVQDHNSVQQYCVDNVKLVSSNSLVGAANTQVLYDCAGLICGNVGMTFNAGTQTLSVTALNVSGGGNLSGTFTGSPTLTGVWTFSAGIVATPFSSTCTPVAATGQVRLCKTDLINWRNQANSGDEGLGTDATDALTISHPGGITLLPAVPTIHFGGETNAFPMFVRRAASTTIQTRLADDSGDATLVAGSIGFNGASSPVLITGACSTGQVLTATGANAVSCQPTLAGVQAASITTNTGTAIGNSDTSWVTKSVTMPLTGCPCRAFVSYSAMYTAGASGGANFWVTDGTNNFAETQVITNSAAGISGGASAASFSPVTYANGANITFSGFGNTNSAGGITIANPGVSNKQSPWLNVVIFTSN